MAEKDLPHDLGREWSETLVRLHASRSWMDRLCQGFSQKNGIYWSNFRSQIAIRREHWSFSLSC